mmetsp:Transcript_20301/g.25096  ORF Transcript_20301/g.25096 Transcript_20301/m.25096 type:complete len:290 (-) Transcript_20301:26-895(-)|eukprot:CAMPEP_0172511696 /NCGR_PEP_ID=MMETSP1066-20121228/238246_1 /TAXON_ID=671091 /ORGANISM="Coscinodiscus wailesii, Strain CCMP2513" /LENGTH=289 /DNA_ID=CAMNT_0013291179 /DNA_START=84 /DNA_END=953 /DNA_ORIENTATION=+
MLLSSRAFQLGRVSSGAATSIFKSSHASAATRRNKSVLVTGGAQGLGEAICKRLAADGYLVTVADINTSAGETVAKEINGRFVELDVSIPEQFESAIRGVVDESRDGQLNALVNNAGVVGSRAKLGDYDIEEWKRIIDVNLNGVFYGLKYGLSQMSKQDSGGSIVNMCSTAGFRGMMLLGPYTPSKFAVRGLTHAAAVEYGGKNIRINSIAPTGIETPMVNAFIELMPNRDEAIDAVTAMNVLTGLPQSSDVASACSFLLSDEARYITGHTLPVDAGCLSRVANSPESG